ncbi:uncharacterized protein LOC131147651 [Malania oleifera]|uniref:uncharacterized protein LOC131147651 n=1 Tax=Malania oleifera TaxID=397392 RepID=UPI0025AE9C1F|nr:uncharacterized protein LOC131147651 [Malania oleifera]
MENQVVARRRINLIAAHFAAADDRSATRVLPVNCSSNLSSVIRRCDNRTYFARQGSCSQTCFMKQASIEQGSLAQSSVPFDFSTSAKKGSLTAFEAPMFSRPATMPAGFPNVNVMKYVAEDGESAVDPPKFARPNTFSGEKHFHLKNEMRAPDLNGTEWSPRMDVGESGRNYVVTVELPGVGINGVRVEVDDQKLTVTGKRSTQWWKVASFANDSISTYHKKEIVQGPYQLVWSLPADVNKDSVAAEFVDGILQIVIPKL